MRFDHLHWSVNKTLKNQELTHFVSERITTAGISERNRDTNSISKSDFDPIFEGNKKGFHNILDLLGKKVHFAQKTDFNKW